MFPASLPARPRPRVLLLIVAALGLIPGACNAGTDVITRPVAPGITLTQEITTGSAPLVVNILRVDLHTPGVKIRCGQARDAITLTGPTHGREPLHSLAARNGAIAAVNADFFPFTGDPVGLAIRDGELLREPLSYRACFGLGPNGVLMDVLVPIGTLTTADGSPNDLDGINRVPHGDELVALTPTYAATPSLDKPGTVVALHAVNLPVRVSSDMQGTVAIVAPTDTGEPLPPCPSGSVLLVGVGRASDLLRTRCKLGDTLHFRFDLTPNDPAPARGPFPSRAGFLRGRDFKPCWTDVEQAVSGGPWLVRAGQIAIDSEAEAFSSVDFVAQRHARTAVGVTANGTLLLVTVDGRLPASRGASLNELAALMQQLGAVNAINLDGGGSSTMLVADSVVNAPSDGRERPIANSLLVYGAPADPPDAGELQVRPNSPDGVLVRAGESLTFAVTRANGDPLTPDMTVLWGTADGLGFISQQGVFTSSHSGAGSIVAHVGARQIVVPVHVVADAPARLKATLGSVASSPADHNLLTVTVLDRFGNPVAGQQIAAAVQGGQIGAPLVSGDNGQAASEIIWTAPSGQRVLTLTAGGAASLTLRR